jgi:hypothetical protein
LEPSLNASDERRRLMTKTADELSEKIAAAGALPEATGMQIIAERFVRMRPSRTLAEIQEMLRSCGNDPDAYDDPQQRRAILAAPVTEAHSKPNQRPNTSRAVKPAATPIYTVAEAAETNFLCQIARAPELAANFIAAKTPTGKVREALAQRADRLLAQRAKEAIALSARRKAITAFWDEVVAKVNAENAGSPSAAPAKIEPWAEIVSDLNEQNARSGSPT